MAKSKRKPPKKSSALSGHEQLVLNAALSLPEGSAVFPDDGDEDKAIRSLIKRGIFTATPPLHAGSPPGGQIAKPRAEVAALLVQAQIPEPMTPFDAARAREIWDARGQEWHLSLTRGEEAYLRWLWYQRPGPWTQMDVFLGILHGRILPPVGPDDLVTAAAASVGADPAFGALLRAAQRDSFSGTPDELATAVVETAVRAGMELPDIIARPWTAVRTFEEVTEFRERVERIVRDTR